MGTRAGFNLINEARDLLLEISSQNNIKSHVFSPVTFLKTTFNVFSLTCVVISF
jgi:ribosomal protein RSM22 (predicted rRNA methylase)